MNTEQVLEIMSKHEKSFTGCDCKKPGTEGIFWDRDHRRHLAEEIAAATETRPVDARVEGNAIFASLADALADRGNHDAAEWVRDNANDDGLYEYVGKLLDLFEVFAQEEV